MTAPIVSVSSSPIESPTTIPRNLRPTPRNQSLIRITRYNHERFTMRSPRPTQKPGKITAHRSDPLPQPRLHITHVIPQTQYEWGIQMLEYMYREAENLLSEEECGSRTFASFPLGRRLHVHVALPKYIESGFGSIQAQEHVLGTDLGSHVLAQAPHRQYLQLSLLLSPP